MDDQNLHTVDDVLASTTGITMYDSPMGGRYVYSRGFRVDTYQFDGVNRAFYYPQADNFTSNAATLDRVEVVRGATGLLQGALPARPSTWCASAPGRAPAGGIGQCGFLEQPAQRDRCHGPAQRDRHAARARGRQPQQP